MDMKDTHFGIIITCDAKDSEGILIKIDTFIARSTGLTAECLQYLAMLGTMLLQTYCCSWYAIKYGTLLVSLPAKWTINGMKLSTVHCLFLARLIQIVFPCWSKGSLYDSIYLPLLKIWSIFCWVNYNSVILSENWWVTVPLVLSVVTTRGVKKLPVSNPLTQPSWQSPRVFVSTICAWLGLRYPRFGQWRGIFVSSNYQLRPSSSTNGSVRPSVRLSVRHTFLTMFPSSYHHQIFRSYYQWQKWCPYKRSRSEVKGLGHRGHNPT